MVWEILTWRFTFRRSSVCCVCPPPTSPPSVLSHWPGRDCWGVWGELQEENQAFHHAYWTWIHVWNSAGQAKCNPICCCTRWLNGCWSHYTQMHKCAVFTPACFIFHLICVFICVFFFSLFERLWINVCWFLPVEFVFSDRAAFCFQLCWSHLWCWLSHFHARLAVDIRQRRAGVDGRLFTADTPPSKCCDTCAGTARLYKGAAILCMYDPRVPCWPLPDLGTNDTLKVEKTVCSQECQVHGMDSFEAVGWMVLTTLWTAYWRLSCPDWLTHNISDWLTAPSVLINNGYYSSSHQETIRNHVCLFSCLSRPIRPPTNRQMTLCLSVSETQKRVTRHKMAADDLHLCFVFIYLTQTWPEVPMNILRQDCFFVSTLIFPDRRLHASQRQH